MLLRRQSSTASISHIPCPNISAKALQMQINDELFRKASTTSNAFVDAAKATVQVSTVVAMVAMADMVVVMQLTHVTQSINMTPPVPAHAPGRRLLCAAAPIRHLVVRVRPRLYHILLHCAVAAAEPCSNITTHNQQRPLLGYGCSGRVEFCFWGGGACGCGCGCA